MTPHDIAELFAVCIVAVIGITFALFGVARRRRARILAGPLATATVTSFQQRLAGKGVPVNETGFSFVTATRKTVNVHLVAPRRTRVYQVGERVQVHHDPVDPERFLVVGDDHAFQRARFVVTVAVATDLVILVVIGLYLAGVLGPG